MSKYEILIVLESSSQDGGIGSRNPSLPRTTKRRITTNLKTINNQKCQKIKLHGTPTMKELEKHSTTQVGKSQAAWWAEKTPCKEVNCKCWAHWKDPQWGGRLSGQGWLNGKLRLRADWTTAGVATLGETPSLTHSHRSSLQSGLEVSKWVASFPLDPSPTDSATT